MKSLTLLKEVKIKLVLSQGQLAVEYSFSLGKSFIVENILEEPIKNKKLIRDYMLANDMTPSTIQITKKMQQITNELRLSMKNTLNKKKRRRAKSKAITENVSLVKKLMLDYLFNKIGGKERLVHIYHK